jgi:hypothetical protein
MAQHLFVLGFLRVLVNLFVSVLTTIRASTVALGFDVPPVLFLILDGLFRFRLLKIAFDHVRIRSMILDIIIFVEDVRVFKCNCALRCVQRARVRARAPDATNSTQDRAVPVGRSTGTCDDELEAEGAWRICDHRRIHEKRIH